MEHWRAGARVVLVLGLALAGSGCVGARWYFGDRWADAKDVFTASVGGGFGAKARVGPVNAGLLVNSDIAGLRAGECFYLPRSKCKMMIDSSPIVWNDFDLVVLVIGRDAFHPAGLFESEFGTRIQERSKDYYAGGVVFLPARPGCYSYYTQVEVIAGIGGSLRLGFNPGELLDFLLGWTTLDIYGDDLAARREREERLKAKEPPPADAPVVPAVPKVPEVPPAAQAGG